MRLFIAEKPELAKVIAANLGGPCQRADGHIQVGNDVVTWCFGHMLELVDPKLLNPAYEKWDLSLLPMRLTPWKLQPMPKSAKQLKHILGLLKQATCVVNAGDPDDEGQLLVDEILVYANYQGPTKRVLINDNTDALVKKELSNLRENSEFRGMYEKALARSVADYIYGLNLTRAYTLSAQEKGFQGVLSVGRVQTPILGLVVRRDAAHESHQAAFYYTLTAHLVNGAGEGFNARYQPGESDPVDEKGRVAQKGYLDPIAKEIAGAQAVCAVYEKRTVEEAPPLPFNLLKLQAEASKRFGIKPDRTLEITQSLREKHKLITYNRSDCQYLSDDTFSDASDILAAVASTCGPLSQVARGADLGIKSRAFNSANVGAHPAIIPQKIVADFDQLSEEEAKIYQLIAKRFIVQFYPKAAYIECKALITCNGYSFKAGSKRLINAGWRDLEGASNEESEDGDAEETDSGAALESLNKGSMLQIQNGTVAEEKTNPPKRYTFESLLMDLTRVAKYVQNSKVKAALLEKDADKKGEQGGIGTPATRSSIIKNLFDRGFLLEQGKHIISTSLARQFFKVLPESATVPDMTAYWHMQQQQIEAGELSVDQFIEGIERVVNAEVQRLKESGLTGFQIDAPRCPKCGKFLRRRKGSNGLFWGCSGYPECKASFDDKGGKPALSGGGKKTTKKGGFSKGRKGRAKITL